MFVPRACRASGPWGGRRAAGILFLTEKGWGDELRQEHRCIAVGPPLDRRASTTNGEHAWLERGILDRGWTADSFKTRVLAQLHNNAA